MSVNIIIQDGRWAIKNSTKRYDIISVDAYRPPYIPWHMTTVEFFTTLQEHLYRRWRGGDQRWACSDKTGDWWTHSTPP